MSSVYRSCHEFVQRFPPGVRPLVGAACLVPVVVAWAVVFWPAAVFLVGVWVLSVVA